MKRDEKDLMDVARPSDRSILIMNQPFGMEPDPILGIFKFGQQRYIQQFVLGHLYMNTVEYFARMEKSLVRADSREGQGFWMQPQKVIGSMKVDGQFRPIPGIIGPVAYSDPAEYGVNIFCMYALRGSTAKNLVNERNFEFGDTFAAVVNVDEFLRRVQKAAEAKNQHVEWQLVEYVDRRQYDGPMGIFRKSSDFSYQSEFRIAVRPGTGAPDVLHVGDLSDIAVMGQLRDLNRVLQVE